jgi:hypothetical protein
MITDAAKSIIAQHLVDTFTRGNVGSGGNSSSPAQTDLDVPLLSGSGSSLGVTVTPVKSDANVVDFKLTIQGTDASITGRTLREIGIFDTESTNNMLLRIPFDAIGPFSASEEVEFFIAVEVE